MVVTKLTILVIRRPTRERYTSTQWEHKGFSCSYPCSPRGSSSEHLCSWLWWRLVQEEHY